MSPRLKHAGESSDESATVTPPESDLLTAREVARRLRVDDTTVRRWIKQGTLEAIVLPHAGTRANYRIKKTTVQTILQAPSFPRQKRGGSIQ